MMPVNDASFRLLANALPQLVWLARGDGQAVWFNQRWLDYSGCSEQSSLADGWIALVHEDDRALAEQLWAQALKSGQPCEFECRLRRADGAYRWMQASALAQHDATSQSVQWLGTLTDVDTLKRTADSQAKDFSITRIAGRVARLGGWTIELPGRTLTWSDENCAIHDVPPGYRPTLQEGIGYFLPEHRAGVRRHLEACLQDGTPYEFVLPKMTAKGRRIWVRSIGEAVRDAAGHIIRLQGAFQDITAQKVAEAQVKVLETRLNLTLESITDGFYLLDKNWCFSYLNGPAELMVQRSRQDLLGLSVWKEFPESVGTVLEHEFRQAVHLQRKAHFENFYPPLQTWFEIHAYPTELGLAVYFHDVTERRQEQAQLRLLETAVARLNDMVIIIDADAGNASWQRMVFVNDAFERHTGYSRAEAIGRMPEMLVGPHTDRAELQRVHAAMEVRQAVRAEVLIRTQSGHDVWMDADITPLLDAAGRCTHWVAVARDVTERRQQRDLVLHLNDELEERVRQRTAQLVRANTELESFAYSISHDLRSPLNTIHGFSQLLAKIEAQTISDKGRHYLQRISAGVTQMGGLIEGLLTLAKLSRDELKAGVVDLSALARSIAQNLREREPNRQVTLQVQDGLQAHGDARLLLSVLQNLIENAWKFTAKTPLAQIEVASMAGANGETIFFVRDNGAGFDPDFSDKLFGIFERLHSPGDFAGTGIGLATVKRVVERHGGRVWAEGRVGQGATFYFTLGSTPAAAAIGAIAA